ncbi:hypothetical protein FRC06_010191 [Ceratobasidium sp. 370]|nr:hypothetical protein FRC06_010191 [Ceratobasidium sp. 370]
MAVLSDRPHRNFNIFVDVQRVLHRLPRASPQTPAEPLPWQAWGEHATRWIETRRRTGRGMCGFHGSRFVTGQPTGFDGRAQLIVADFNRALVQKFGARESIKNSAEVTNSDGLTRNGWPQLTPDRNEQMVVDTVDEETPTVVEGFTETPIISRLPYRVAVVSGPSLAIYHGWTIDDDRLVGFTRTLPDDNIHEHLAVHYIHD